MSESEPLLPSQALSTQLNWGSRSNAIFNLSDALESSPEKQPKNPPPPQKSAPTAFSEAEIDQFLKKLGLKPEDNLRQAARFLMAHHFKCDRPLLEMAHRLLPNGPWESHGPAEALMAALSRLPLDEVARGFEILMTAFNSKHPTVMALLHHIVAQLQDLTSQWLVEPEEGLAPQLMVEALDEEILHWKAILESPRFQMQLLIQRGDLLQQLRRLHLFLKLSLEILQASGSKEDQPILKQLHSLQRDLRHAIELILGDAILSQQDQEHHFRENGQCSTLGLWSEGEQLPCRLWADGEEAGEENDEQEQAWSFRFHWHDELLKQVEAEVQVWQSECDVQFQSDSPNTREVLNEQSEALAAKLRTLGFEPSIGLAKPICSSQLDPEAELHISKINHLQHIDSEA
jgi:hypothetical protein